MLELGRGELGLPPCSFDHLLGLEPASLAAPEFSGLDHEHLLDRTEGSPSAGGRAERPGLPRPAEAEQMVQAAEVVRRRGPGGLPGLGRESAEALGALLETLAEDWRERPTSPRVREHAARAAQRLMHDPIREPAPQFSGPLPAGYESPVKRRNVTDHPP